MENSIDRIGQELKELEKKRDDISYQLYGGPDEDDYEDRYEQDNPEIALEFVNNRIKSLEAQKKDLERKENHKAQILNNNISYQKAKEKFKIGSIKVDRETKEDKIGRDIYASTIAKYIVCKKTEVPFNIGVFGEWGEGKSSFLEMIEKEINNSNHCLNREINYHTHIVKYDATEYSDKDKIWACILKKLFEKFEEEKGYRGRLKFFWNRFKERLRSNMWKYIINLFIFVLTILFGIIISQTIETSKIKQTLIYISLGAVPFTLTMINVVIPAIKGQLKLSMPIADVISKNMELPDYDKELGKKENLRKDLMYLEQVWVQENERIVIFIDEVDRCSEKAIIELLEALQLFLKSPNIVIVMSVDIIAISKSLYKDNNDRLKLTVEYLEKYITLPIYLKEIKDYNSYIDFLLDKEESIQSNRTIADSSSSPIVESKEISDNKFSFTEQEEKLIKEIIYEMNIRNHITPRKVKRILNMLNLSKQMCIALCDTRSYEEKILFDNYIKWFFFAYFNPEIAFILEEQTKYVKYPGYSTVNEMCKSIDIYINKDVVNEKIVEEKIVEGIMEKKNSAKISTIKETIKGKNEDREFIWLKKNVEEITKSQLNLIKEVSRIFIICEKNIKQD